MTLEEIYKHLAALYQLLYRIQRYRGQPTEANKQAALDFAVRYLRLGGQDIDSLERDTLQSIGDWRSRETALTLELAAKATSVSTVAQAMPASLNTPVNAASRKSLGHPGR